MTVADQETDEAIKDRYVESLSQCGDRATACEQSGATVAGIKRWSTADKAFRQAVAVAWESARVGHARAVRERVMQVVLMGAPEVQTYKGRPTLEVARHPDGQPILDRLVDADGRPVSGYDAEGKELPQFVERLRLDAAGEPIPIVTRRYAEKTTLRLAESLGVLTPADAAPEERQGKDVVFLAGDGRRYSLAEVIRARFVAATPAILPLPEEPQ